MFFRVDFAIKIVVADSRDIGFVNDAHILMAIAEHGGPSGDSSGDVIEGLASTWEVKYSGLCSRYWKRLDLGKEYFCLVVELLSVWSDRSRLDISCNKFINCQ